MKEAVLITIGTEYCMEALKASRVKTTKAQKVEMPKPLRDVPSPAY